MRYLIRKNIFQIWNIKKIGKTSVGTADIYKLYGQKGQLSFCAPNSHMML